MAGSDEPGVESSTTVWIGSMVITCLGVAFGLTLTVLGSLFRWRSDGILGLYDLSGWRYHNLIKGDGKLTLALGVLAALFLVIGLLAQNRVFYMAAACAFAAALFLSIYELIYIATRPGITGAGTGLYMVLGGAVAGLMCSLGGYLMMVERRRQAGAQSSPPVVGEVV